MAGGLLAAAVVPGKPPQRIAGLRSPSHGSADDRTVWILTTVPSVGAEKRSRRQNSLCCTKNGGVYSLVQSSL